MKRRLFLACLVVAAASAMNYVSARQAALRTLDDRFPPPRLTTLDAWNTRADYLRAHVLASAGLLPLPEKTAAPPGGLRRGDARRLPRVKGLLRERSGVLRDGQPVSADR